MSFRHTIRRRVNFAETDLAGIAHFSNFFRWMEETEHSFYRSLGLTVHSVDQTIEDGRTGWPRLKASAEYRLPLYFEEEVEVELLVAEMRSKAIRYDLRFWKNPDDPAKKKLAARGELVVVAVRPDAQTREIHATAIPNLFRERITPAPPELLTSTSTTLP
ncbi:MAG: thioesterase superfamily protein [Verrucomicrobiales bacterium]|nr:thioesterase superfamily protein [Verrucomicrobiales bacterium]